MSTRITQLTPADFAAAQVNGIVVDVREASELAGGRVPGSRHIPLRELPARYGELEHDRLVVLVCQKGHRSQQAAEFLRSRGYSAANLEGGMDAWHQAQRLVTQQPFTG